MEWGHDLLNTVVMISEESKGSFNHLLCSNFCLSSVSHVAFPLLLSTIFLSLIYIHTVSLFFSQGLCDPPSFL